MIVLRMIHFRKMKFFRYKWIGGQGTNPKTGKVNWGMLSNIYYRFLSGKRYRRSDGSKFSFNWFPKMNNFD